MQINFWSMNSSVLETEAILIFEAFKVELRLALSVNFWHSEGSAYFDRAKILHRQHNIGSLQRSIIYLCYRFKPTVLL